MDWSLRGIILEICLRGDRMKLLQGIWIAVIFSDYFITIIGTVNYWIFL